MHLGEELLQSSLDRENGTRDRSPIGEKIGPEPELSYSVTEHCDQKP
jgi:hypothetical protein